MNDPADDTVAEAPIFDMKAMRDKFRPVIDTSKAARKARHKALTATAKASSRRATARLGGWPTCRLVACAGRYLTAAASHFDLCLCSDLDSFLGSS